MEVSFMKRILKYLIVLLLICSSFRNTYAQECEDMSKWSFKILLQNADQMDELKIVRYRNKESGRYGFCMEPEVDFSPRDNEYFRNDWFNEEIYDIFRAFEELGEDYYIAAQLMIWEYNTGIRYSFDGKDASDYGEDEIKGKIASFAEEEMTVSEYESGAEIGKITSIHIEHLDELDIVHSDVKILDFNEDTIRFIVEEDTENELSIDLKAKHDETYGSVLYHSESSQDLYSYEGDYQTVNPVHVRINAEKGVFTLNFSKTDLSGNPVAGAQFTVYEITDKGDEQICIIAAEKDIDLRQITENYESVKEISVSERYDKYLDGYLIRAEEPGYFDCQIMTEDSSFIQRVYVCSDISLSEGMLKRYRVRKISDCISGSDQVNTINHLESGKKYLLCESKPKNGYSFVSDPCVLADEETAADHIFSFVNRIRNYDFILYKENPDHDILLNGAHFTVRYKESGIEKEKRFVTGALNIIQENDHQFVLYRHENDGNIYVGEFTDGTFIKEDAVPGKYHILQTDEINVNDSSLLEDTVEVIPGAFQISDIPYDSIISVTETEAPKGYYIEEAQFTIDSDIDYSLIVSKNYRVNSFEIIPGHKRRIPKTCIGD